jgi:hypothetical protein
MTPVRAAFLTAADSAAALIAEPAVAAAWSQPSALAQMSVGALAAHLGAQVQFAAATLDQPPPDGAPVGLVGHYDRVSWIGADLDAEVNVTIRTNAERTGSVGADAVVQQVRAAIDRLRDRLATEPPERTVSPPAGPWALTLDDFLVTRMMEIAVHSDDLACSVGVDTPDLPETVLRPVFELLTALAVRRHGPTALLRALSRAERAPGTVAAF